MHLCVIDMHSNNFNNILSILHLGAIFHDKFSLVCLILVFVIKPTSNDLLANLVCRPMWYTQLHSGISLLLLFFNIHIGVMYTVLLVIWLMQVTSYIAHVYLSHAVKYIIYTCNLGAYTFWACI